jgi:hypothetical protein
MPRRTSKPIKHTPFVFAQNEGGKTRYPSKVAAEEAAELRMLQNMSLELGVYQGADGGWYLTSQTNK